MDKDAVRRGLSSFFKRFGLDLALLAPGVLLPYAQICVQTYGPRATLDVVEAWGKIALGQLFDSPVGMRFRSYEQICALKTAPLFEVACALVASGQRRMIGSSTSGNNTVTIAAWPSKLVTTTAT